MEPLIRMLNITKEFPGVKALDNISFVILPGEVHVLIGENGASEEPLDHRTLPQRPTPIHRDTALLCHYMTRKTPDGIEIILWDTVSDFRQKILTAQQCGVQGILTLYPEIVCLPEDPE